MDAAVAAAVETASAFGLAVDDAVVLNESNRFVVRLLPCDVVARVTPVGHYGGARQEVDLVARLTANGSPVVPLVAPRLVVRDGFQVGLWAHVETTDAPLPPSVYATALERLHAGLREVDLDVPHVTERIEEVRRDVEDRDLTPDLADGDRALLVGVLANQIRAGNEQPLHGEPHPGNVLVAADGPLFVDFENAARGPVEYDLAWTPAAVSDAYDAADAELVDRFRGVVLAMIAVYRWRRDDRHPSGRASGVAFVEAVRSGPPYPGLDEVTW